MKSNSGPIIASVLITLLALGFLGGSYLGVKTFLANRAEKAQEAQELAAALPENPDTDGDGLPDIFEDYYRTDPNNADTDGDGTNDFDELDQGRDPAVAGASDVSDVVKPKTGSQVEDTSTLTGKYLASLPDDADSEEILDGDAVTAFVELEADPLLPELDPSLPKTNTTSGAKVIELYLDSIASSHNEQLTVITNDDITEALAERLQGNSLPLQELISDLESNLTILVEIAAPAEVAELHQQLLQANRALIDNVRLLASLEKDFIAGLVGSHNVDRLAETFDEIATQVRELESKYELE